MACASCGKRSQNTPVQVAKSSASPTGPFGSPSPATDLFSSLSSIPLIGETQPILRNWQNRPPTGGWAVTISVGGIQHRFDGTPRIIHRAISKAYSAAGREVPSERIWDFLNLTWSAREPNRVLLSNSSERPARIAPAANAHLSASPSTFGPKLWGTLSVFGIKGHFDKQAWLMAVTYITRLLDPASNENGCAECHHTWTAWKLDNPPEKVENEHQAAFWVFELHNKVNSKLGKKILPFEDAIRLNQWAFDLESGTPKPV